VDTNEGRAGVSRVEAFSDGVIAIIVTIMVLELHAPEEPGFEHLWALWPTFLAYALSYAYIAIYWVNHHRLFTMATRVTNGLVWSNIALLFCLSLVPFTTAYLGNQHFAREPMMLYIGSLLLPAFAYSWLQAVMGTVGNQTAAAKLYRQQMRGKGIAAVVIYVTGFILSATVAPWTGLVAALIVALLWLLPESRLNTLFTPKSG
jgi:uncharacterized membrane protein